MTTHALPHPAAIAPIRFRAGALFQFTIEHFLLLPICGLIALVWANTRPESYFTLSHTLAFTVNEIGMALFFALITQEVVEEVMPGGALHTWRRWMLPMVVAVGGTLGSAFVYLAYVDVKYEAVLAPGWPVAGTVDLAFAYFLVKAIFRRLSSGGTPRFRSCCCWRSSPMPSACWSSHRGLRSSRSVPAAPRSWRSRSAWRSS